MERVLWPVLYRLIREAATGVDQKYVRHQPGVLLAVFAWAAIHDRPVSWACDPAHWDTAGADRPARIPSAGTLSRRLGSLAVALLLRAVEGRLRAAGAAGLVAAVDGKPLPIGGAGKDRGAGYGRAAGHVANGYKFHAIWSGRAVPEAWEVTSLNGCEKAAAGRMLGGLAGRRGGSGGGYLLGDGNYDASWLFDAAAAAGFVLLAPARRAKNPGCGKHYQSPHRARSRELLSRPFGRAVYRLRADIERRFAHLCGFAGGLAPLPAWARTLRRVEAWVWAKLLINGVRALRKAGRLT
jgi:hypothetical protein